MRNLPRLIINSFIALFSLRQHFRFFIHIIVFIFLSRFLILPVIFLFRLGCLNVRINAPGLALYVLDIERRTNVAALVEVLARFLFYQNLGQSRVTCPHILHNEVVVAVVNATQRAAMHGLADVWHVQDQHILKLLVLVLTQVVLVSDRLFTQVGQVGTEIVLIQTAQIILIVLLLPRVIDRSRVPNPAYDSVNAPQSESSGT